MPCVAPTTTLRSANCALCDFRPTILPQPCGNQMRQPQAATHCCAHTAMKRDENPAGRAWIWVTSVMISCDFLCGIHSADHRSSIEVNSQLHLALAGGAPGLIQCKPHRMSDRPVLHTTTRVMVCRVLFPDCSAAGTRPAVHGRSSGQHSAANTVIGRRLRHDMDAHEGTLSVSLFVQHCCWAAGV